MRIATRSPARPRRAEHRLSRLLVFTRSLPRSGSSRDDHLSSDLEAHYGVGLALIAGQTTSQYAARPRGWRDGAQRHHKKRSSPCPPCRHVARTQDRRRDGVLMNIETKNRGTGRTGHGTVGSFRMWHLPLLSW
jgi:hypothetical protein